MCNKIYNRAIARIAIIVAIAVNLIGGCGARVNSDGIEEVAVQEDISIALSEAEDVDVSEVEEDLPALAYKTSEERQSQRKPVCDQSAMRKYNPSNQFLMIEEVINEPEGGWPEGNEVPNDDCIRLKGTLYEVFFYDEPDYDLVYFPGDELPEGYEVRVTEGYEIALADDDRLGDGHRDVLVSSVYLVTENNEAAEYQRYFNGAKFKEDVPDDIPLNELVREQGPYLFDILLKPGMYVDVLYDDGIKSGGEHYVAFQYLTKEDLEALPEGVTLADNVVHY